MVDVLLQSAPHGMGLGFGYLFEGRGDAILLYTSYINNNYAVLFAIHDWSLLVSPKYNIVLFLAKQSNVFLYFFLNEGVVF